MPSAFFKRIGNAAANPAATPGTALRAPDRDPRGLRRDGSAPATPAGGSDASLPGLRPASPCPALAVPFRPVRRPATGPHAMTTALAITPLRGIYRGPKMRAPLRPRPGPPPLPGRLAPPRRLTRPPRGDGLRRLRRAPPGLGGDGRAHRETPPGSVFPRPVPPAWRSADSGRPWP